MHFQVLRVVHMKLLLIKDYDVVGDWYSNFLF
jgi:hypothetical protein